MLTNVREESLKACLPHCVTVLLTPSCVLPNKLIKDQFSSFFPPFTWHFLSAFWEPGADGTQANKAHPGPDSLRSWIEEGGTTYLNRCSATMCSAWVMKGHSGSPEKRQVSELNLLEGQLRCYVCQGLRSRKNTAHGLDLLWKRKWTPSSCGYPIHSIYTVGTRWFGGDTTNPMGDHENRSVAEDTLLPTL